MPITKSAKKALRQNKKRKEKNLRRLRAMREVIKQIRKLVEANKKEEALKLLPRAYKTIDKTAKANIIKKNAADRKKSRLTKLVNKTTTPPPSVPTPVGTTEDKPKTFPEQS